MTHITMQTPKQQLTLFDSTCLIVGIIIGVGIYQMAPDIAKGAGSAWGVFGIWILGGLLSLCGAMSYAELASAYPNEGGDYVYFNRAYGKWAGFLFGWAQMAIVRPGDIAVMAFAFGTYASSVWDPFAGTAFPHGQQVYATAAVTVLTLINVAGVKGGKWTQNLLTTVKAATLLFIVIAVFVAPPQGAIQGETAARLPFSLALIFVMFTYGGWNEMAYVAAEVKDPDRNIVRTLVWGTCSVIVLYLMVNGAFLYALGYQGLASSKTVAADAVAAAAPRIASLLVSAMVCVSALGAVSGLIFAGARISYAMGTDHRLFRLMGKWHQRFETPAAALILQGVLTITLIVALGSFVNAVLYTAATVYSFYLASTLAVFVLRSREPGVTRPYRVTGYPVTPLVFAGMCVFLIYSAVIYKPWIALAACGLLLVGLLLYLLDRRMGTPG
jgi:amino acid transporter